MITSTLLIPFALNDNNILVKACKATKGNNYRCPSCKELLIYKCGSKRVAHFAHKASNMCSEESILHKTAKLLLAIIVNKHKDEVKIKRVCKCGKHEIQHLSQNVHHAKLEQVHNAYRLDVGIFNKDNILIAGLEVFVSHKVDDEKWANIDLPLLELDGKDIINNPTYWNVLDERNCFNIKHEHLKELVTISRVNSIRDLDFLFQNYR